VIRFSLLFVLVLLAVPLVSAQLRIVPNDLTITPEVGVKTSFLLNLTNDFSFDLFQVRFTSQTGFSFPEIARLMPGESRILNISYETDRPGKETVTPVVSFLYYIPYSPGEKKYNVTITDTSYVPERISIRAGDSIIWRNNGTVIHTVTVINGTPSFDQSIGINQTHEQKFPQMNLVNYYDKAIGFVGRINVTNATTTELSHNSAYDKTVTIRTDAKYIETALSLLLIEENFTVQANEEVEGSIRVKNEGASRAYFVNLTAEKWVTFDENNFNLSAGEYNYVAFAVKPTPSDSTETGKNYTIKITASANNTPRVSRSIYLYVPFTATTRNQSACDYLWELERVCTRNPGLQICNPPVKVITKINETTKYKELELGLTKEQVQQKILATEQCESKLDQAISNNADLVEEIKDLRMELQKLRSETNRTNEQMGDLAKAKEEESVMGSVKTFGFLGLVLVLMILGGVWYYFKSTGEMDV